MQTASLALPLPEKNPSVSEVWIKNNVIAALIAGALGAALIAADKLFGLNDPNLGMGLRIGLAVLHFVAMVGTFAAYAVLTGTALARKLPGFSMRGWTIVHLALGAAVGALVAIGVMVSDGSTTEMPADLFDATGVATVSALSVLAGAIIGAIFGGIQAAVIRKAASGAGTWVAWSVLSGIVLAGGVVVSMAYGNGATAQSLTSSLLWEGWLIVITIVTAIIMLPAVKRLTPRG